MECRYTEIPEDVEENTIMFVYGWFGLWNDDPCSIEKVRDACKKLNHLLGSIHNVKVIIGMRSEHFMKYLLKIGESSGDLFHIEIRLDAEDVHKDNEHSKIFDENIKQACENCKCKCKGLKFSMLRKGHDKSIGIPLKINVLAKYHDLISNYIANDGDLLKVMTDHFTALETQPEKKHVYEWIMYICLKGVYPRSENVDNTVITNMKFGITVASFDEHYDELSKYIRKRDSDQRQNVSPLDVQYIFWHPFIYICAFHYLYKKNPDAVMSYCNIDAILQLVRPDGVKTYLEVSADSSKVDLFYRRLQQEGLLDEYREHPLISTTTTGAQKGY
jgi:hypothetical protein